MSLLGLDPRLEQVGEADAVQHLLAHAVDDGESDGRVSLASARLEGMTDFIVVPRGHAFIMRAPEVAEQTIAFLRRGRFDRIEESP